MYRFHFNSCVQKPALGCTMGRLDRIRSIAATMSIFMVNIKYEAITVADLDLPAKQCTKTRPPALIARPMKLQALAK